LETQTKGTPIVVFNPLNIAREDLVEASVSFSWGTAEVRWGDGSGWQRCSAQISDEKNFSGEGTVHGYAVLRCAAESEAESSGTLQVSDSTLENQYYKVKLDADGDVASIFDKSLGKELLSAPIRLAISYDNPEQWPAWNMDWEQEQAAPKTYVAGPGEGSCVVEDGPARVAVEVSRETAGSKFVTNHQPVGR